MSLRSGKKDKWKEEAQYMSTTIFESLTKKPLNAKYYPLDEENKSIIQPKKDHFFAGLSNFIIEVLAIVSRPNLD